MWREVRYYHVWWISVAGWQNPLSAYLLYTCKYWPCQRSCAKRTCYTYIRTDHQVAILGLSIYRSLRKVTNTEPPRWALQIHVDLPVQGSPSLSFLCGGCQHYCHPDDDRISGWVWSNAVLYGGCDGCKWNILYQLLFSKCYSLMPNNAMQRNAIIVSWVLWYYAK